MKHTSLKKIGIEFADWIASFIGSWTFIIIQTIIVIAWIVLNTIAYFLHFDPYPFILMNLLLSSQAAYATPMILMSSNRQAVKDREELVKDLKVDENSNQLLQSVVILLTSMKEDIKLDRQSIREHAEILTEIKKINNER